MVLAKRNPSDSKEKPLLVGAVEPFVGGIGDVVIPKQDTLLCIADRSLSRLRGSPLPGAGCLGPGSYVGCIVLPDAVVQVLSLAWVRLFQPCVAAAALPPVRVWVAVPLWVRPGAWPRGCAADTPDIDAPFSAL